jgi:hypothetical protein
MLFPWGSEQFGVIDRQNAHCSEQNEYLSDVTFNVLNFLADNVEANSLGKRSALTDSNNITDSETESWGAVSSNGPVAFLEPVVLLDVVEVVAANDDSVLHLGGNDDTPK